MALQPFEWKDKPALIEHLFPVQKISAESYKEQMSGAGKTLTALGSYWKGRKPLILNKACILGSLLPITDNLLKDLEIFELLMGMDKESMRKRIETTLPMSKQGEAVQYLSLSFNDQVRKAKRPEEIDISLFNHVWTNVNEHLGTSATSFPELIEQMGIARFGRRPRVADVFSGSGQIPFEAARLGCDVYASDLNPIACMLTWGAFNIVGANKHKRDEINEDHKRLAEKVQQEIDALDIESDGKGWKAKAYLYCVEVKCPETGWLVPLIPSLIISRGYGVICDLVPVPEEKRYDICVKYVSDKDEIDKAANGTVQGGELVHSPDGDTIYRVKISTIRGDYKEGKDNKNKLRMWEKTDFIPRKDDIFQERLYAILWMRPKQISGGDEYEFRSVTTEDLEREKKVIDFVGHHIVEWQNKGYIPDMVIENGYNTDQPIREKGWTHWHHLFNPRQLLIGAIYNKYISANSVIPYFKLLDYNAKLCRWHSNPGPGRIGKTEDVFYNQSLNTLFNYATRASNWMSDFFDGSYKESEIYSNTIVKNHPAQEIEIENDLYITDPPYGNAVKYEEITEFFIAWVRKNTPKEFENWVWDSRRSIAIKGEDDSFRQGMIAAYRKMAQKMPDNGLQVLMFTHQSGAIWADMTNIIWASGLQVTAAWYVVTETDSALRQGANVKGTIILVLRKRHQELETFRDELGWEIEDAVKEQVESLMGLDKEVRAEGSEGLYTDADLQMAGYAAALKVLTSYSRIDGRDMTVEAEAPRIKGQKTFVDELIDFAVQTAVQFLAPVGFEKEEWQKLQPIERLYMKMLEMEQQGAKTLDNYQNFAKAFKIRDFDQVMSEGSKANAARLKLSTEFKGSMMAGNSEIADTSLRALLYAMYEISKELEVEEILDHLMDNCPNYLQNKPLLVKMADYIAEKRTGLKSTKAYKPDVEASYARILAEAIRNQRL